MGEGKTLGGRVCEWITAEYCPVGSATASRNRRWWLCQEGDGEVAVGSGLVPRSWGCSTPEYKGNVGLSGAMCQPRRFDRVTGQGQSYLSYGLSRVLSQSCSWVGERINPCRFFSPSLNKRSLLRLCVGSDAPCCPALAPWVALLPVHIAHIHCCSASAGVLVAMWAWIWHPGPDDNIVPSWPSQAALLLQAYTANPDWL